MELTRKILDELLHINAIEGTALWKERDVKWFSDGYRSAQANCNLWNSKFAGKSAGSLDANGYIVIRIFSKSYKLHRIILFYFVGIWPSEIDHKNGLRSDNRFCNLRDVNHSVNMKNQRLHITNSSGVIGVGWYGRYGKWRARITVDGAQILLGYFDNFAEAVNVRQTAEERYYFHKNHGNRVDVLNKVS